MFRSCKIVQKQKQKKKDCGVAACVSYCSDNSSTVKATGNSLSDTSPMTRMSNAAGHFGGAAVSHLGRNQCKRQSYHMVSQKGGKTEEK